MILWAPLAGAVLALIIFIVVEAGAARERRRRSPPPLDVTSLPKRRATRHRKES